MPEETNIAYVTVVLVTLLTFKFQQIVRSWYSVQVTFVCTALWKIYLRSNLPNLFKIRRDLRKLWRNTFWCVFYAPKCMWICHWCKLHGQSTWTSETVRVQQHPSQQIVWFSVFKFRLVILSLLFHTFASILSVCWAHDLHSFRSPCLNKAQVQRVVTNHLLGSKVTVWYKFTRKWPFCVYV